MNPSRVLTALDPDGIEIEVDLDEIPAADRCSCPASVYHDGHPHSTACPCAEKTEGKAA